MNVPDSVPCKCGQASAPVPPCLHDRVSVCAQHPSVEPLPWVGCSAGYWENKNVRGPKEHIIYRGDESQQL